MEIGGQKKTTESGAASQIQMLKAAWREVVLEIQHLQGALTPTA